MTMHERFPRITALGLNVFKLHTRPPLDGNVGGRDSLFAVEAEDLERVLDQIDKRILLAERIKAELERLENGRA